MPHLRATISDPEAARVYSFFHFRRVEQASTRGNHPISTAEYDSYLIARDSPCLSAWYQPDLQSPIAQSAP